jgi:hypothetical protein
MCLPSSSPPLTTHQKFLELVFSPGVPCLGVSVLILVQGCCLEGTSVAPGEFLTFYYTRVPTFSHMGPSIPLWPGSLVPCLLSTKQDHRHP